MAHRQSGFVYYDSTLQILVLCDRKNNMLVLKNVAKQQAMGPTENLSAFFLHFSFLPNPVLFGLAAIPAPTHKKVFDTLRLEVDVELKLTHDSRQLSSMLLHSMPISPKIPGLAGRSLLDFFTEDLALWAVAKGFESM